MPTTISWSSFRLPVSDCCVAWTDDGVCALSLNGPNGKFLSQFKQRGLEVLQRTECRPDVRVQMEEYFDGERQEFSTPLDFVFGTAFQHEVWTTLTKIPFGETRSYKWLAEQTGRPRASRAVGHANGRNPIPVIVPCHRVISANGTLGGYTGGLDLKRKLLALEGVAVSQLISS
jgi:methylated-DNA-[protein]-cysteine S-methyltransferase